MVSRICPNCGGKLVLSRSKTMLECLFCGTEFEIGSEEDREELAKKAGSFPEEFFCIERDFASSKKKKQTGKCIDTLLYCMNELGSAGKVEDHIRKSLLTSSDTAAEGINEKLLDIAKGRIEGELEAGESIIVYKDQGIFSKGKEFTVLTDRRFLFFTKKKCTAVYHTDMETLRLEDSGDCPAWYINGDLSKRIPSMEASGQLSGAVVALAVLLGFEQQPYRGRIRLI